MHRATIANCCIAAGLEIHRATKPNAAGLEIHGGHKGQLLMFFTNQTGVESSSAILTKTNIIINLMGIKSHNELSKHYTFRHSH
jgi:hypothetical protein